MTQHGHTVANTTGQEEQTTKQRSEEKKTQDGHHHGLPVVFTTACGGGGMAVLSGTHGHSSFSSPSIRVFLCGYSIFRGFYGIKAVYSQPLSEPIPLFHHFFIIWFQFLEQIREKEGEAKNAKIPCRVCDRKTQARFWLTISFPSLLFPNFRFMFCNFDLNLQFDLGFLQILF